MSNILYPIVWQPEDYALFRKCGEITVSPDAQCLGFNCGFCPSTCLKTDVFLDHLQDQHKEQVFNMYQIDSPTLDGNILELHEIQILNNNGLDVNLSNINLQQISCVEDSDLINENSQRDSGVVEVSPKIATLPVGRNALNVTEDSNNLWPKTQTASLSDTNPFESISTPMYSPNSYLYADSSTATPGSTIPDNDCEIDDGEDSGIVVAQIPCSNACTTRGTEGGGLCCGVCSGFSDCLSLNGDSSSKVSQTVPFLNAIE